MKQFKNRSLGKTEAEHFRSESIFSESNRSASILTPSEQKLKPFNLDEKHQKLTQTIMEATSSQTNTTQRLTVDMPASLHKALKIWCVTNNLKMNEFVRDLIRQTIKM